MKEYYNVFDSGYGVIGFSLFFLLFALIGVNRLKNLKKKNAHQSDIDFMKIWTGLAILMTILVFIGTSVEYVQSIIAMKNETYKEVEGFVENFEIHRVSDSFTVKEVYFEYSKATPSAGFNKTKDNGGPIDEGKYVRIRYYKGRILQLWIKE